jgi:hypothetical protein
VARTFRDGYRHDACGRQSSLVAIRPLVLTVVSLVALAAAPAAALGASADTAASEAYVRANYALVSAGHAKLASSEAALQGLLGRMRRECPLVVAGSPQNEASEKLTWEVAATMRVVRTDRPVRANGAQAALEQLAADRQRARLRAPLEQ